MYIQIRCSQCDASYRIDGRYIGRTVTCKKCGSPILVPPTPMSKTELADLPLTTDNDIWPEVLPLAPVEPLPASADIDEGSDPKDTFGRDLLRMLLPARGYREWRMFLFITLVTLWAPLAAMYCCCVGRILV